MVHSHEYLTLVEMLKKDVDDAWSGVVRVWAESPRVYSGPSGPDGFIHPAFDLAQLAPIHIADIETRLTLGLANRNANVAAYCALSLSLMNDHCLPKRYIDMVADRTEILDVSFGCFGTAPTLAEFAVDLLARCSPRPGERCRYPALSRSESWTRTVF